MHIKNMQGIKLTQDNVTIQNYNRIKDKNRKDSDKRKNEKKISR